jgi:hypothetical protein
MGQFILKTKFKKNRGLIISPSELIALYFYGVNILSKDGSKLDYNTVRTYISAAQQEIEKAFGIRFKLQLMTETQSYYRDEYANGFPFFSMNYLVNKPVSLIGMLGSAQQVIYPENWLVAQSNNQDVYGRIISLIPSGRAIVESTDVIFTGFMNQIGLMSFQQVPQYWNIQYITGFSKIPYDLLNVVGMMAAIPLLGIAGDLILGAGIASQSVSIDGLSQSISSTSSATNSGYGARVIQYQKSIKDSLARISRHYKRFRVTAM